MFSLFNGIYDSYLAPTQLNLLVVGAQESGKTTLLERLKVTEIPTRPRKGSGGHKTVQQRIGAEEPPMTLENALAETGAMARRLQNRTSSITSLAGSVGSSQHVHRARPVPAASSPILMDRKSRDPRNAGATERRKRFSICPAPQRYSRSAEDQHEAFIDEETQKLLLNETNNNQYDDSFSSTKDPPRLVRCHSKEMEVEELDLPVQDLNLDRNSSENRLSSMQSIGLDDDHPAVLVTHQALQPKPQRIEGQLPTAPAIPLGPPLLQSTTEEYNTKPKAKMLPLRLIRPTIGTNLAKLDMYGAKCHIFDVGGRLQDLWEKYYDDCDAIIFCWKLGEDPDKPPKEPDSDDDSDAEEDDPYETIYKKQQELLNTVRKSVPDDVPFLILGHVFGNANADMVDKMYTTAPLLPRYHNPMTGFCCASAKTGAGVQSAMEWLIPLAKRQQMERMNSKRELDMMLGGQGKTL